MTDRPTVTTSINEIPDSWSEEDVERIQRRLENIARGIESQLAAGKSKADVLADWRTFCTQEGIQNVDIALEEGDFKVSIASEERR